MAVSYIVSTSSAGHVAWLTGISELNRKQHTLPVLSADRETKGDMQLTRENTDALLVD